MYLVFWVRSVDSLAVSAGLQQDLDGIELQEDLTGHAVEEGDVGQGCRRQEEHFTTGGGLAQLWQNKTSFAKLRAFKTFKRYQSHHLFKVKLSSGYFFDYQRILFLQTISQRSGLHHQHHIHSLMSAVTMSCMLSRKLPRCCVDVWWGEVIWATTAAASALAASTLLSSVKISAKHRIPSTYTLNDRTAHVRVITVLCFIILFYLHVCLLQFRFC